MSGVDPLTKQHYESLRLYLASYLASQKTPISSSNSSAPSSASNQRASARDKLTRLTLQQFQELSTDVFDEMTRRQDSSDSVPFLPVKDEFHPKRNQARQKLATLPNSRFKDLASDVYYELERRHPDLPSYHNGTSTMRSQQLSQEIPLPTRPKSEMSSVLSGPMSLSVDQPKQPPSAHSPGGDVSFASLDNLMADLGNILNSKSLHPPPQSYQYIPNGTLQDSTTFKSDDEVKRLKARVAQLEAMQNSNHEDASMAKLKELEDRLAAVVAESKEKDAIISKLSEDAQKAKENYESLQEDYNQQQQIANDIRAEATNLLEETKSLSRKNDELLNIVESDQLEIKRLKEENENLQKLADATDRKSADRALRESPSFDYTRESLMYVEGGVITKQRMIAYQVAIEDLVRATRSDQPPAVLVAMKSIVLACKAITEDIDHFEQREKFNLKPDFTNRLAGVRTKLSVALTSIMTAAKSHAQSYNGSTLPTNGTTVMDVESAVKNLTTVIFDLVRCSRITDENITANGGIITANGTGEMYDVDELKIYLEQKTDLIVQAIQSLLLAMRQNTPLGHDFKDTVSNITRIVDNLINVSRKTLSSSSALSKPIFASSGDSLLERLSSANMHFSTLGDSMVTSPQSKILKQQLAASSYEIAKHVKELISQLD